MLKIKLKNMSRELAVLAALKIGMIVIGVQSFWQFIVTGIIIVIAAYFETIQDKLAAMMFQRSSASAVAK